MGTASERATAQVSPANAMTCVKPFTIPDRWNENQTGEWDPDDSFDLYQNNGQPLPNPGAIIGPAVEPQPGGGPRRRVDQRRVQGFTGRDHVPQGAVHSVTHH